MVVCFALHQNIDVMPSGFDVVSNDGGIVIFKCSVFLPLIKPSFSHASFANVKTIIIPAICSVNNSGLLWTINAVLVRRERFNASNALKNDDGFMIGTEHFKYVPTFYTRLFMQSNACFSYSISSSTQLVRSFPSFIDHSWHRKKNLMPDVHLLK